ncbi:MULTISPECIES: TadE/TadG family type IV pilus assembly protein [unclassified Sphingomonas]|uniref:TadE/TadG family type IV pilus assembly protein n=2 Tax=Pseudomonadota TaxID=1224 RepID=UPI000E102317|nr:MULTISPECIES: TadE/TadG family type IV pilus assembly protein [unclassified Sphingomonas]AXJ94285.1 pilus assembly protein [Sphingomonas sp. FARSPH]
MIRAFRMLRDRRGTTIVEFAIVAPCLVMLLIGMMDLGLRAYVGVQLQGALEQAARQVTVSSATGTATITGLVSRQIQRILPRATVVVTPSNYYDFVHVGKPEPITTDTAPIGTYNAGDCFQDLNGNGVWDADSGGTGTGGSDDIVYYQATVTYPNLLPVGRLLGFSGTTQVTGTTMMKNQPYGSQPDPATICT